LHAATAAFPMKIPRQQVLGGLLLAAIVLIVLLVRAWPILFHK